MKKCEQCKVNVNTEHNTCPLCFGELVETEGRPSKDLFKPKVEKVVNKHKEILVKIFLFLSIIAVVASLLVNLLTKPLPLWSLLVVLAIFYCWVLIGHTILSSRSILEKLILQIGTIIGLLFVCEWVSGESKWMVDYVIPSIAILISVILFILAQALKGHKGVMSFFIMICMFVIITGLILILNLSTFKLLNIIAIATEGVCLIGIILFSGKALKTELSKKFYV